MRVSALVCAGVLWCAVGCGKVRSLDDAGPGSGSGIDAAGTVVDAGACENATCSKTGDGCCPSACNAGNDADCPAVCGNDVIEPGETCDPLASCPTACPAIGCQLRTVDKPGTCGAACVNGEMITACSQTTDSCCPAGCNAANDIDCAATCDNGVLEPGEQCDPLATCPTDCPQQGCSLSTLFDPGTCHAQCVVTSQQTECVNGDGCCPGACNANNDSDCAPKCGNNVIEAGETCDPPAACACGAEAFTCYGTTGDPSTCDLVCHVPVETCGIGGDNCCAFDTTGGCDVNSDKECIGPRWDVVKIQDVDLSKGCQQIRVYGVVQGGSYDFSSCVPTGPAPDGNPYVQSVVDSGGYVYPTNDDCLDKTALPYLAGWTCTNASGRALMYCTTESPGGFIMVKNASFIAVTVCPVDANDRGIVPFYVWFNAPTKPHLG